jgi:hypothetical protein
VGVATSLPVELRPQERRAATAGLGRVREADDLKDRFRLVNPEAAETRKGRLLCHCRVTPLLENTFCT